MLISTGTRVSPPFHLYPKDVETTRILEITTYSFHMNWNVSKFVIKTEGWIDFCLSNRI